MRIFGKLLIGVAAVAAILVAVSYLLPRNVTVERTAQINAPAEAIFPYLNSMAETQKWSPWLDRDPDVVVVFEGPEAGVGNRMSWTSQVDTVGSGTQIITVSIPDERVETALDFGEMGTATALLVLDGDGDVTDVTWGLAKDMGMNPIARYMGLMMDGWVGPDYEAGLDKLKALVEAG